MDREEIKTLIGNQKIRSVDVAEMIGGVNARTVRQWRTEGLPARSKFFSDSIAKDKEYKLISYLSRGRTLKEIEATLGLAAKDLHSRLLALPPTHEYYHTRNTFYEDVFIILPKINNKLELKEKIWTYHFAKEQPYLMIQMPKTKWEKILIAPIADVHFGHQAHLAEKFREYVNWIKENDNVFCFIAGDLLENAFGDSCKGVAWMEQDKTPHTQGEEMIELLRPIAHKILWAIPGNHENRSRIRDFDPLEFICSKLEIPYSREPIYADILWNGYVFDFFVQHGRAAAQTKGGKINAAARPLQYQEFTMFTCYAHVHDEINTKVVRICRDRTNFRLQFKKQYICVLPSFLGYFETYAAEAGYTPGAWGAITSKLYKDGDYHYGS